MPDDVPQPPRPPKLDYATPAAGPRRRRATAYDQSEVGFTAFALAIFLVILSVSLEVPVMLIGNGGGVACVFFAALGLTPVIFSLAIYTLVARNADRAIACWALGIVLAWWAAHVLLALRR